MTNLFHYMKDGAHYNARAVLCFLQGLGNIEGSYDSDYRDYKAELNVARWENCREQGYIVSLRSEDRRRQLNIAFFEHRNSDNICAIKWEQNDINSINISTMKTDECYKDKWNVSHTVSYNEAWDMAGWIKAQFENFWEETKRVKKNV